MARAVNRLPVLFFQERFDPSCSGRGTGPRVVFEIFAGDEELSALDVHLGLRPGFGERASLDHEDTAPGNDDVVQAATAAAHIVKDLSSPHPELIDAVAHGAFALAPLLEFSRQAVRTAGLRRTAGRSDCVSHQLADASREQSSVHPPAIAESSRRG